MADFVWDDGGFAELLQVVKDDVERRCLKAEGASKQLCPVDTGRLRASITHEVETRGTEEVVGRIGTNVEYAVYQELGTSRHPAHPYLRPGLASAQ